MTRYYCSGFDKENAFGHGLGNMFRAELKNTDSIVYIPGSPAKIEKAREKYIPLFTQHFKNAGIVFKNIHLITPDMSPDVARGLVKNASFIMLMGGDPFAQKALCEQVGIMDALKNYNGLMVGFSAGAMLMSKHIIITPCSDEYPDFHIEPGLNLDGISIYPHNNTADDVYPDELVAGDETYKKADLIRVAREYAPFYLLQDNARPDGKTDVSIIKSSGGKIEYYLENNGKIWRVDTDVKLVTGAAQTMPPRAQDLSR